MPLHLVMRIQAKIDCTVELKCRRWLIEGFVPEEGFADCLRAIVGCRLWIHSRAILKESALLVALRSARRRADKKGQQQI